MESGFGRDFGHVRIHTDAAAADSAHAIDARAYTYGHDVVFGPGQFSPSSPVGLRLIAHELTHVAQQSATCPRLARAPLNLKKLDIELFWGDPLTQDRGEIGFGAKAKGSKDDPSVKTPEEDSSLPIEAFVFPRNTAMIPPAPPGSTPPASTPAPPTPTGSEAAPPPPSPVPVPTPTPREVTGDPKASQWRMTPKGLLAPARRALVVSGIHGDERGALDLVKQLQSELAAGTAPLARDFDTIVIPAANPGGINKKPKPQRENLMGVDLNRNFPGLTGFPSGKRTAPEQPEVKAIMTVVRTLRPERILSLHGIEDPGQEMGGVYADPVEGDVARQLACRMALRMRGRGGAGDVNVKGNRIDKDVCSVRYPLSSKVGVTMEESSLGAWGSASPSAGGQGIPVITHEVTGKQPLAATGAGRSVDTIMPGIREFLLDNEHLTSEADVLLQSAVSEAFLSGEATTPAEDKTRDAIVATVKARFEDMRRHYKNFWLPLHSKDKPKPPGEKLFTIVSGFRSFARQTPITTGALAKEALFKQTNTDDEIKEAILKVMKTISLPGFSRHAWGTEIDVVSATRTEWEGNGPFVSLIPFLKEEAPRFGFYHPYSDKRLSATLPHYEDEPWHLSYWTFAAALQAEYMRKITGAVLDKLIAKTAKAIKGGVDEKRLIGILAGMNLTSFQSNVAPPPK